MKDTVIKLSRESRTMLAIARSDKEEFDRLRGNVPAWMFFRKMLAVYMAHVAEEADKSGGIAA